MKVLDNSNCWKIQILKLLLEQGTGCNCGCVHHSWNGVKLVLGILSLGQKLYVHISLIKYPDIY